MARGGGGGAPGGESLPGGRGPHRGHSASRSGPRPDHPPRGSCLPRGLCPPHAPPDGPGCPGPSPAIGPRDGPLGCEGAGSQKPRLSQAGSPLPRLQAPWSPGQGKRSELPSKHQARDGTYPPPGPRSESRGDSKGLWSPSMGSSCFARLLRWMGFAAPGSQTGSPALLTPAPPPPLSRDFKQWGQVPGSLQPPNCLRPRLQPHLAIKPTSGVSSAARCQWPGAGDRCTDGRRAPREAGRGLSPT